MYYVYILQGDKKHYIGYTGSLDLRMEQHKEGTTQTTKGMGSLSLIGYFTKETKKEAIVLEKMIKRNGHIHYWISHPTFITINKKL